MKKIKYFLQFITILFLFVIYKLLGLRISSILSGYILQILGPFFRSKNLALSNLKKALPNSDTNIRKKILKKMWFNYGQILSEYVFLKNFRKSTKFEKKIVVDNQNILDEIKSNKEPVIFISGHFNNFELMAMHIEKSGIDLAAVYRPLNNIFLNPIMENIRKRFICNQQIKKGIQGTKEILKHFKSGASIALMIDQRVSQGIKSPLFNKDALTTTIPAQFAKKFNAEIVPVYIERLKNDYFRLKIYKQLKFQENDSVEMITTKLNKILEDMIINNPEQWIWTHNRWK